jgi:hypothetical protein
MPQIALVSFDAIQSFLEVEDSEEGLITLLSCSASMEIENFTHRVLCNRVIEEFHDGYNQNSIILKEYPVTLFSSLQIWHRQPVSQFISMTTDSFHYELNSTGQTEVQLMAHFSFPRGERNIKATYTAGYSPETIPEDLQMAVLETVSWLYKRHKSRQVGVDALIDERNTSFRYVYDKSLPKHVIQLLQPYRRKGW